VIFSIVGDVGNVVLWWISSDSRLSLNPSIIGNAVGADAALIGRTVILLVFASIYGAGLFGLTKRKLWAP
jgi:hypothetical protein